MTADDLADEEWGPAKGKKGKKGKGKKGKKDEEDDEVAEGKMINISLRVYVLINCSFSCSRRSN